MRNPDAHLYTVNACAMWRAVAPDFTDHGFYVHADLPAITRIVITRPVSPATVGEVVSGAPAGKPLVVEDLMHLEAATVPNGVRAFPLPVMLRRAAPVSTPAVKVTEVADAAELAETERLVVEAFPLANFQPLVTGSALPPRVLDIPGWRVWLTRGADGRPAAACYTFDDGAAVGLYWVATHPDFRRRGLGRAVVDTALAAHPGRDAVLVATEAGAPLYELAGFRTVSTMTWYTRKAA